MSKHTLLVFFALLAAGARPGAAQCCRPSVDLDEVVAGAAGDAVLRGPWMTARWRQPLPRLALFTLGSLTYEKFVDHSGWSWRDFNQRLVSYLVTETIIRGVQRLRRRPSPNPPPGPLPLLSISSPGGDACADPPQAVLQTPALVPGFGLCRPGRRW